VTLNNALSGTVDVQNGILAYSSNLTNNRGTVKVEAGARFNIGGSLTNAAEGVIGHGTGHRHLHGTGRHHRHRPSGGTLAIHLTGGFTPDANAVFNLMTYANMTGAFSVLRGDSAGYSVDFSVNTSTDPRTLMVRNINVATQVPAWI